MKLGKLSEIRSVTKNLRVLNVTKKADLVEMIGNIHNRGILPGGVLQKLIIEKYQREVRSKAKKGLSASQIKTELDNDEAIVNLITKTLNMSIDIFYEIIRQETS